MNNENANESANKNVAKKGFKEFFKNPWNVVGAVLCIILIPILLMNCILILKSMIYPSEVPSIGGYSPLIVLTQSMDPEIKEGDLIICKKTEEPSKLKEGDVISFFDPESKNNDSVVTHEIIAVIIDDETGEVLYRTKGVNNDIEDRSSVPSENVIGVYTGVRFPIVGSVVIFAQTPVGLLVCVGIPVAAFVVYWVLKRKKEDALKNLEIENLKAELNNSSNTAEKADNAAVEKVDEKVD